jgi:ADP-ribose pyrophosphatase YjhB (NUDIX family)
MKRIRKHCAYCGGPLTTRLEGDVVRDYCTECEVYFYDNPLPVVSSVVVRDRQILLVKRKFDPGAGLWCLPMGFAESGESIETAALRELEEEAGIKGKITGLVDIESGISATYGDLLFVTFEVEWSDGDHRAGDDASEVRLFSFDNLPKLAFSSNTHAIKKFLIEKEEYWAILDSFSKIVSQDTESHPEVSFLSAKLIRFIDDNAEVISRRWLEDVRTNRSTPTYASFDAGASLDRSRVFILHYERWLEGKFSNQEIRNYYQHLGATRKAEGFSLSELLSAISLTRKHIWEFSLTHGVWNRTIDIYMALELERNMMLFFDKVSYHMAVGFEMGE